jgi:hypothetical protein
MLATIWNSFFTRFDDFRKGLVDFLVAGINFFSGAEFPVFDGNKDVRMLVSFNLCCAVVIATSNHF